MTRSTNNQIITTKRITVFLILAVSVLMLGILASADTSSAASAKLKGKAKFVKAGDVSSVTVSWKKPSSKVRLYKIDLLDSTDYYHRAGDIVFGYPSDYKTTKTYPAKTVKVKNKTSYTFKKLKNNRFYVMYIRAYARKGKVITADSVSVNTGVRCISFDFEECVESADSIKTEAWVYPSDCGYEPCKLELYKKAGKGKWKAVKTFKAKSKQFFHYKFDDKKVTLGGHYKYKIRGIAVTKVKGRKKTVKGPFSAVFEADAFNRQGYFNVSLSGATPAAKDMKKMEFDIRSDEKNADVLFRFGNGDTEVWTGDSEEKSRKSPFVISDYKTAGGEWHKAVGDVSLSRGESIGLRIVSKDGEGIDLTKDNWLMFYNAGYGRVKKGNKVVLMPFRGTGSVYPAEWDY